MESQVAWFHHGDNFERDMRQFLSGRGNLLLPASAGWRFKAVTAASPFAMITTRLQGIGSRWCCGVRFSGAHRFVPRTPAWIVINLYFFTNASSLQAILNNNGTAASCKISHRNPASAAVENPMWRRFAGARDHSRCCWWCLLPEDISRDSWILGSRVQSVSFMITKSAVFVFL